MGYIERIRDSAEEENMSEEDVEKLIDMVVDRQFKEAIEQYDKQEESENE